MKKIVIYISAIAASLLLLASTGFTKAKDGWITLSGCQFVQSEYFDADSFHLTCNGHDRIFRLYFVDAPEKDYRFGRIFKQAEYFKTSDKNVLMTANEATAFAKTLLSSNDITIETKWRKAGGQSKLPRYYAVVKVSGQDMADLLVEKGYARVFGTKTDYPDGTSKDKVEQQLRGLEQEAKAQHKGAWSFQRN